MSDFNKRLYLNIGWIGDPDYTPFIFTIAIDAELKSRIAKLANILTDSSAVAIETPVKNAVWSCFDDFEMPQNDDEARRVLGLISADELDVVKTTLIIREEGFEFEAIDENGDSLLTSDIVPFHSLGNDSAYYSDSDYLTLEASRGLARRCNAEWEAREAIDWQEAEDLIKTIRTIPPKLRAGIPDLEPIIYLSHVEEWDSGMVAQWPDQIIKAIDAFYRQPVPM